MARVYDDGSTYDGLTFRCVANLTTSLLDDLSIAGGLSALIKYVVDPSDAPDVEWIYIGVPYTIMNRPVCLDIFYDVLLTKDTDLSDSTTWLYKLEIPLTENSTVTQTGKMLQDLIGDMRLVGNETGVTSYSLNTNITPSKGVDILCDISGSALEFMLRCPATSNYGNKVEIQGTMRMMGFGE